MYRPTDHIYQLADYIKKNLIKGYTLDSLKYSLINQGYSRISVEKAIELANQQLAEKAPIMKERPSIAYKVVKNDDNEDLYKEDSESAVTISEKPKKSFLKKIFGL
jgi:hypothetical protein